MKQHLLAIFLLIVPLPGAIAGAETNAARAELEGDCYASVGPVLKAADGHLTANVRKAYLDWAEKTILSEIRAIGQTVQEGCLAEVHKDPVLRAAIFGSVFPPDSSILQNYAQLHA
jgi:hypothetical protein